MTSGARDVPSGASAASPAAARTSPPRPDETFRRGIIRPGEPPCEEFIACTTEGTTVDACIDCINGGGGALCDAALACPVECDGGAPICDSGLSSPGTPEGEAYAACASENCCGAGG